MFRLPDEDKPAGRGAKYDYPSAGRSTRISSPAAVCLSGKQPGIANWYGLCWNEFVENIVSSSQFF